MFDHLYCYLGFLLRVNLTDHMIQLNLFFFVVNNEHHDDVNDSIFVYLMGEKKWSDDKTERNIDRHCGASWLCNVHSHSSCRTKVQMDFFLSTIGSFKLSKSKLEWHFVWKHHDAEKRTRHMWNVHREREGPAFMLFECNTESKQMVTNCTTGQNKFDSLISPFEIDVLASKIRRQLNKLSGETFFSFLDPNLFDRLEFIRTVR